MTSITQTDHHGNPMEPISEKSPITLSLLLVVAGWIIAALMAYSAFDSRVSVLENQMLQFRSDVAEVKGDVKQLLRRP